MPLFALGKDQLTSSRVKLQETFKKSFNGQRTIIQRKQEIIERYRKAIELRDTIR